MRHYRRVLGPLSRPVNQWWPGDRARTLIAAPLAGVGGGAEVGEGVEGGVGAEVGVE